MPLSSGCALWACDMCICGSMRELLHVCSLGAAMPQDSLKPVNFLRKLGIRQRPTANWWHCSSSSAPCYCCCCCCFGCCLQAFNEQTERTQNYKEATSVWSARIYTRLQAACKHQLEWPQCKQRYQLRASQSSGRPCLYPTLHSLALSLCLSLSL